MNTLAFEKTVENVRIHRHIKLVTTEKKRNYLMSEPNYNIKKFFTENLLAVKSRKLQIVMNKQGCLSRFTNIRSN